MYSKILKFLGAHEFEWTIRNADFGLVRRGVALAGTPLNFRWLAPAMVLGVASMLVLIMLASLTEIFGLFALLAASAAAYLLQTRRWPGRSTPASEPSVSGQ